MIMKTTDQQGILSRVPLSFMGWLTAGPLVGIGIGFWLLMMMIGVTVVAIAIIAVASIVMAGVVVLSLPIDAGPGARLIGLVGVRAFRLVHFFGLPLAPP